MGRRDNVSGRTGAACEQGAVYSPAMISVAAANYSAKRPAAGRPTALACSETLMTPPAPCASWTARSSCANSRTGGWRSRRSTVAHVVERHRSTLPGWCVEGPHC